MIIHVVREGDVLWRIADYYEADINAIIEINELTNTNLLLVGQSLLIPTPGVLYTVKYGDTLWSIAQMYGVPLIELMSLNRLINPNLIYPGIRLTIPQKPRPAIEVNAYTYVFGGGSDIPTLENYIDNLTYITPFSYNVGEDGRLAEINDEQVIQFAISSNVIPMMSIINFSFNNRGDEIAHTVLNDIYIINKLLDDIIYTMKEKGYRGLNVVFRNILPEDIEAYNNFLQMASSMLHAEGFFISTTLVPNHDKEQNILIFKDSDYDLDAHGIILDFVIFLVNDWTVRDIYPGAISPVNNIRSILDKAISSIPREKILLDYEIYARDWVIPSDGSGQVEPVSVQEAMNRALRNNVRIQYDEISQAPFYFYKDNEGRIHEVWFEDARSAQAKFDLVKEYRIRGISFWSLGYYFPQKWYLLEDNFIVVKD